MAANNGYAKARPVVDPDGTTYKGVRAASRATGIELSKLHGWIKGNKHGWKYVDAEPPKPKGRKEKVFEPMSVEEATSILEMLPEIRDWITSKIIHAEKSLLNRIAFGEQIDGYVAKENKCRPHWRDTAEVIRFCESHGLPEDYYIEKQLKSPAEIHLSIRRMWCTDLEFNRRYAEAPSIEALCERKTNTVIKKVEESA